MNLIMNNIENKNAVSADALHTHTGTSFNELLNKITLGDSYELIKQIPDNSIDLIVTDPPYIYDETITGGWYKDRKVGKELVNLNIIDGIKEDILEEFIRIMKNINIYIWCNKAQIMQYLDFFCKKHKCSFDIIIWKKTNPAPLCSNTYLPDKEYCLYFRKNGYCKPTSYSKAQTVFTTKTNKNDKDKFWHPTIKPLDIIKIFIENSSKENEIIFDPFSGSGTTCVAAKELNRQYIGIEIDPEYHKISIDRLEGILANGQTSMFMS